MHTHIPTVAVAEVDPAGPAFILDVREDDEWSAGHIETAVHLPMYSVPPNAASLPTDRPIIVVCKVGGRSAQVTGWLRGQGFDAYNLEGGMLAWEMNRRAMVAEGDVDPFVA